MHKKLPNNLSVEYWNKNSLILKIKLPDLKFPQLKYQFADFSRFPKPISNSLTIPGFWDLWQPCKKYKPTLTNILHSLNIYEEYWLILVKLKTLSDPNQYLPIL